MTINFIQKKSFKEKAYKALSVFVGVVTILNVSMVGALIPTAQAAPPPLPNFGAVAWSAYQLNGHNVTDFEDNVCGINDSSHGPANVAPDSVDLASNAIPDPCPPGQNPGTAPTLFTGADADYFYFRVRLADTPLSPGGGSKYDSYHWDVLIDTNNDHYSNYVLDLFGTSTAFGNGASRKGALGLYLNNPNAQTYNPSVPANVIWQAEASATSDLFTNLSVTPENAAQYFLDLALPKSAAPFSTFANLFASTSASNTDPLQKDWMSNEAFFLELTQHKSVVNVTRPGALTVSNPVKPGDTLRYTLSVANTGTIAAPAYVVSDDLTDLVDYTGAPFNISNSGSYNGTTHVVSWPAVTINPSTTITRTFDVTVKPHDQWPGSGDFDIVNVYGDRIDLKLCNLTITKSVDRSTALPGDVLTYTVDYQNTGTANCTGGGVRIDDVTPPNTTYVNGSNTQQVSNDTDGQGIDFGYDHSVFGSPNPAGYNAATKLLSWDGEVASPGESGQVSYQVTVNQLPVCTDTNIDNTAKIYADQLTNGVVSNSVRTTVSTPCNGDLTVNKHYDDNGDGQVDRTNPQGWTWDLVGGSQNNTGGSSLSLPANSYTVTEDAIANYSSTWSCTDQTSGSGATINLSLAAEQALTCTFLNTRDTGTLTVRKNVDTDGDGDVDVTGATNWSWDIQGGEQNIATGSTRTLVTSNYTINEDMKADYHVTDLTCDGQSYGAVTQGVVAISKGHETVCTFTNTRDTGSVQVNKLADTDGNGSYETSNPGTFTWTLDGGSTKAMGSTVSHVLTGTHSVDETVAANYHFVGWYRTGSTQYSCANPEGTSRPISVDVTSDTTTSITLCNARDTGGLTVIKAIDTNGDGIVDDYNTGWTWDLDGGNQNYAMGSTQTVTTGSHDVAEDQQANYHSTGWVCVDSETQAALGSGSGTSLTVNVTTHGATCTFTNARDTGTIDGYKFNDLNGDGTWNDGEPGLDGWTIQLSNGASVVTGANEWPLGYYRFSLVPTGTYTVNELVQSDWTNTTQNPVGDVLISYNQTTSVNFGNFRLFDVTVCKYVDVNGDGSIDGDPLYTAPGGWDMTLNQTTQATVEGCTTFSDLGPGGYTVNEESKAGWTKTYPVTSGYAFDGVSGQDRDYAFGNFQNVSVEACKIVDNDGNLETTNDQSPIMNWTINLSINGQTADTQTTGENGCYTWTDLRPGVSYDVSEAVPAGWTALTPTTHDFGPATSGSQYSYTFANFENFDVRVCKKVDVNGDGDITQDPFYQGGWDMTLNQTTQATVEGCTTFSNLGPGGYTLSEADHDGWIRTYPDSGTIVFDGASGLDRDFVFGNFQLGKISGYKFNDLNGNGTREQDEPPLNDWTILLNGSASAVTGSGEWPDGYYEFTGLEAGVYTLSEDLQPGWTQTYPQNPATHSVNVTSGTDSTGNDFGNFQNITISGQKFNDLNGNGLKDQGEPGLPGWTINLDTGANGSVDASTVTNGSGDYSFVNLGPGTYRLREVQQGGWTQTTSDPSDIVASSGSNVTGIDFGNFQNVSVEACKIVDNDGNLETTNDQSPIMNWTVNLSINGQTADTQTTGENGCYTWTDLRPGVSYDVSETVPAGWTALTPTTHDFGPATSGSQYSYTFANFELGKIAGYKLDEQENPLDGWQICLTGGPLSEPLCVYTGAGEWPDGYYEFDGLMAGTYTVSEEDRFGWTQIYPDQPGTHTVVVTSGTGQGAEPTMYDFGNRLNVFNVDIEKSAPATVTAGNQMSYTLSWSVSGNIPVENVTITDAVPANTTFVSASDPGVEAGGTVTWNLGTKNPGDNGSVTMTVLVNSPLRDATKIDNTAVICGDGELVLPEVSSLLSSSVTTNPLTKKCDDDSTTTEVESDFTVDVEKTAAATVEAGTDLTYTITWSVAGNSPIDALVITDAVPTNTSYVSASNGGLHNGANPGVVTWNLGAHVPGDSGSVTMTVHVVSPLTNGTVLTNTAVLCGTTNDAQEESFQRCDDDTTTTTVSSAPTLDLLKSADPTTVPAGSNVNWTVKWSIGGNSLATSVTITDPIPANSTFVSVADGGTYDSVTNTVTWNLGTQAPGASGEVHYVTRVASPIANGTVVTNIATIDSAETDPAISASAVATVTSAPDLTITKASDLTTFTNPGKSVNYTVVVTNKATATDTAKNVVMTDTLPSGFTFATDGTSTKAFAVGDLTPGQSKSFTFLVNISGTQAAGTYVNTAKAKGDNTTEVTATTPVEVRVPTVLTSTSPDLTIVKQVAKKDLKPGDVTTYTLTVTNIGDGDATNVIVTDTIPSGLSFVHIKSKTATWNLGTLKPGHSRVINVDVRVNSNAKKGTYENVATVTADDMPVRDAKAAVNVTIPKVLGLATTGVRTLDYLIVLAGLVLIAFGIRGLRSARKPIIA